MFDNSTSPFIQPQIPLYRCAGFMGYVYKFTMCLGIHCHTTYLLYVVIWALFPR